MYPETRARKHAQRRNTQRRDTQRNATQRDATQRRTQRRIHRRIRRDKHTSFHAIHFRIGMRSHVETVSNVPALTLIGFPNYYRAALRPLIRSFVRRGRPASYRRLAIRTTRPDILAETSRFKGGIYDEILPIRGNPAWKSNRHWERLGWKGSCWKQGGKWPAGRRATTVFPENRRSRRRSRGIRTTGSASRQIHDAKPFQRIRDATGRRGRRESRRVVHHRTTVVIARTRFPSDHEI